MVFVIGAVPAAGAVVVPGVVVVVVVVAGAAQSGAMVTVCSCDAVNGGGLESATWTVNLNVPALVGVPVIAPSEGDIFRPGGRLPDTTDHVYGPMPPCTLKTLAE